MRVQINQSATGSNHGSKSEESSSLEKQGMNLHSFTHDKDGVFSMKTNLEVRIGPTLIRLMNEQGLSLKELSFSSGVPQSTISHMRNNRQPRDIATVMSVAEALSVSLFYLLYGKNEPTEKNEFINELIAELFSGVFEIKIKKIKNKA